MTSAAPTANFPPIGPKFSIEPIHGFVQIIKEQLFVSPRGHHFQGLTSYVVQHPSVASVIEDKSIPEPNEFRQMCVIFHGSHTQPPQDSDFPRQPRASLS
jgi:hypothetical protein